ncbi:MAG: Cell division protein ftsZ [Parcubacteria group bacterium GW2011_GWA2_47_12]|nr:MAG: Cell division protein ftsZ [Parcubacteria group bacterium GW2011_GWA2_47_12]
MPLITPEVEAFARIKVFGIGGSGKNALNHMINSKVRGVEFVAINTDAQDLHNALAKKKIHIGKNVTRGLGAGMNPEVGKRAVEENKEEIQEATKGADMVFITGGLGGGTFSGAAPTVAKTAKELGALTVAVTTKPFFFEGSQRMKIADQWLEELRKNVDAIITIPNDRLLASITKDTSLKTAFAMSNEVLRQAVEGISDLITTPGIINLDFADIRAILENAGSALMGIGSATGDKRAEEAAKIAINSPLLEVSINGAKGTIRDEKLKKGEIRITVIASGFPESSSPRKSLFTGLMGGSDDDKRGKQSIPVSPISTSAKETKTEEKKTTSEDDDWSSVPAFLRRAKK